MGTTKIDLAKALKLRNKGATLQQIADSQGLAKSTVYAALAPISIQLPSEDDQERIRRQVTPLMEYNLHRTLAQMTNCDDAKEFKDRAIALGILNQNVRLNSGQSTQNIASLMASAVVQATKRSAAVVDVDAETVDNSVDNSKATVR